MRAPDVTSVITERSSCDSAPQICQGVSLRRTGYSIVAGLPAGPRACAAGGGIGVRYLLIWLKREEERVTKTKSPTRWMIPER